MFYFHAVNKHVIFLRNKDFILAFLHWNLQPHFKDVNITPVVLSHNKWCITAECPCQAASVETHICNVYFSQQNLLIPRNASRKEARKLILDAPIKQKCMAPKTDHPNAAPTQDGSQPE